MLPLMKERQRISRSRGRMIPLGEVYLKTHKLLKMFIFIHWWMLRASWVRLGMILMMMMTNLWRWEVKIIFSWWKIRHRSGSCCYYSCLSGPPSSLRLHMEETKRKHEKKIIFLASFANVATDECGDLLDTASDKFNFNLHTQTHTILNIEQFRIVSRYFFYFWWMHRFCIPEQSWSSCLSIFKYTIYTTL